MHHSRERSTSFSSSISGGEHGRMDIDLMLEGKENLSIDSNSVTPEQIVCAPSLPGSPSLTPSPKRVSHSPRGIAAASPNSLLASSLHQQHQAATAALLRPISSSDLAARLSEPPLNAHHAKSFEMALRLSAVGVSNNTDNIGASQSSTVPTNKPTATVLNMNTKKSSGVGLNQPQIFVKQGVSKCKECNIVFCKYENYLAHKKHYCSARNSEDKDGAKPSPPPSPLPSNVGGSNQAPQLAYQQLICAACGIKFTSLDNLNAHQMYYCPKRIEIPVQVTDFF